MSQLNDTIYSALRTQLYTGTINDMIAQWLIAKGARGGQLNDLWASFLNIQVATELVVNGTFDTDVLGWSVTANGTITWDAGEIRVTNTLAAVTWSYQVVTTVIDQEYYFSGFNTGLGHIKIGNTAPGNSELLDFPNLSVNETVGDYFVATSIATYISLGTNSNNIGSNRNYDNLSTKAISNASYSINDLAFAWLRSLGYTGQLNDMWLQFWVAGGVF